MTVKIDTCFCTFSRNPRWPCPLVPKIECSKEWDMSCFSSFIIIMLQLLKCYWVLTHRPLSLSTLKYSNIVMCYVILFLLLQIFHTCHIWTFLIDVTLTFIICYVHFVSVLVNLMSSLFIKLSLTCMESLSKKSFKVWCISKVLKSLSYCRWCREGILDVMCSCINY